MTGHTAYGKDPHFSSHIFPLHSVFKSRSPRGQKYHRQKPWMNSLTIVPYQKDGNLSHSQPPCCYFPLFFLCSPCLSLPHAISSFGSCRIAEQLAFWQRALFIPTIADSFLLDIQKRVVWNEVHTIITIFFSEPQKWHSTNRYQIENKHTHTHLVKFLAIYCRPVKLIQVTSDTDTVHLPVTLRWITHFEAAWSHAGRDGSNSALMWIN